jgi:hypothetical protein
MRKRESRHDRQAVSRNIQGQGTRPPVEGQEQPRQEAFVNGYGDVDWDRYDKSWAAYNARRAQLP